MSRTSTGIGINAGAMRDSVTIQTRSSTQDSQGQPAVIWSTFVACRAEVTRVPGKEIYASDERNGRVPTAWKLRWQDGITPVSTRLLNRGKVYQILSAIDPTGRHEELLVTCLELVGQLP